MQRQQVDAGAREVPGGGPGRGRRLAPHEDGVRLLELAGQHLADGPRVRLVEALAALDPQVVAEEVSLQGRAVHDGEHAVDVHGHRDGPSVDLPGGQRLHGGHGLGRHGQGDDHPAPPPRGRRGHDGRQDVLAQRAPQAAVLEVDADVLHDAGGVQHRAAQAVVAPRPEGVADDDDVGLVAQQVGDRRLPQDDVAGRHDGHRRRGPARAQGPRARGPHGCVFWP